MQQISAKEYKIRHDWVGKVIHLEFCKKFKFDQTIVDARSGIRPGEWDAQTSLWFWDTNGSLKLGQTTRSSYSQQKKKKKKKRKRKKKEKEKKRRVLAE